MINDHMYASKLILGAVETDTVTELEERDASVLD